MSQCQTCLVLVSQVINSGCGLWKSGFRLLGLMTLSGWHLTIDCVFTIGTLLHNGIDLFRLSCWLICFLFPQKLKETQLADSLLKKKVLPTSRLRHQKIWQQFLEVHSLLLATVRFFFKQEMYFQCNWGFFLSCIHLKSECFLDFLWISLFQKNLHKDRLFPGEVIITFLFLRCMWFLVDHKQQLVRAAEQLMQSG